MKLTEVIYFIIKRKNWKKNILCQYDSKMRKKGDFLQDFGLTYIHTTLRVPLLLLQPQQCYQQADK